MCLRFKIPNSDKLESSLNKKAALVYKPKQLTFYTKLNLVAR